MDRTVKLTIVIKNIHEEETDIHNATPTGEEIQESLENDLRLGGHEATVVMDTEYDE